MKKVVCALLTAMVVSAVPSAARGVSDGDNGDAGFIKIFSPQIHFRNDNQLDNGSGIGLSLGGMKGEVFGAYLTALRTLHDDGTDKKAVFTGLTWDLKIALPLFRMFAPYGHAGLGRYVLERSQTVYRGNQEGSGINGYQVGAGIDFRFSNLFSLNVGYTKRRMEFDSGTPGEAEIRQQIREYNAGLSFHF